MPSFSLSSAYSSRSATLMTPEQQERSRGREMLSGSKAQKGLQARGTRLSLGGEREEEGIDRKYACTCARSERRREQMSDNSMPVSLLLSFSLSFVFSFKNAYANIRAAVLFQTQTHACEREATVSETCAPLSSRKQSSLSLLFSPDAQTRRQDPSSARTTP